MTRTRRTRTAPPAAPDAMLTALVASCIASDASDVTPDAPPAVTPAVPAVLPVTAPRMYRRTIGTLAAGDLPSNIAAPIRTLSIAARFAALHLDPGPVMFNGAFLNVTPTCSATDAPLLDPDALGYVSVPSILNRATIAAALALIDLAAPIVNAPTPRDATIASGALPGGMTPPICALYAHDRAMRATRTRALGYHDMSAVSPLDIAASLTRAACRLARLPVSGAGNLAALRVLHSDTRAALVTRLAALSA